MKRLVLDIGNTRTSVGVFIDGSLDVQWRITTTHWTADDLWVILRSLLKANDSGLPERVVFACVVPQVRHSVRILSKRYLGVESIEVNQESSGIAIDCKFPHEIGADRLANAVGALALGSPPAIIVDFGTATTFDVINEAGTYLGGAISPGVGTAAGELFKKAEKINPVDLEFPESPLGQSTSEAVCSGVLLGAVGATDYIVDKLKSTVKGTPELWATGGWAPGIAGKCRNNFKIYPELTLVGIDRIGERAENG
ncbi:MAG: type III pantothenate kinase [Candidatus Fermentibacteraceae bacterium]|nr:type III pantothenate kinase [Candidatus Fermentibacteraceae bacterium]